MEELKGDKGEVCTGSFSQHHNWTCGSSVDSDPLKKALVIEKQSQLLVEIVTLYFVYCLVHSFNFCFLSFKLCKLKECPAPNTTLQEARVKAHV